MKHYLTILPYLCIGFCIGAIATLFFLTKPPYQTYICGKIKYIQIGSSVINYTEDSLTLENELSDRDDDGGSGSVYNYSDTTYTGGPNSWDSSDFKFGDTLYYKKFGSLYKYDSLKHKWVIQK